MSFAGWVIVGVLAMGPLVSYDEDQFGSIALCFETEAVGYSRNMPGQSWANDVAMNQCRENGGESCRVIHQVHNACGAVAVGDERITTGAGRSPAEAASAAMQQCTRDTENCTVALGFCTDRID